MDLVLIRLCICDFNDFQRAQQSRIIRVRCQQSLCEWNLCNYRQRADVSSENICRRMLEFVWAWKGFSERKQKSSRSRAPWKIRGEWGCIQSGAVNHRSATTAEGCRERECITAALFAWKPLDNARRQEKKDFDLRASGADELSLFFRASSTLVRRNVEEEICVTMYETIHRHRCIRALWGENVKFFSA